MRDKLNNFVANLNGQFVEVSSKSALYQCMDLVYNWAFCLDYPKSTIQHTNAFEVYTSPNANTLQYFDRIPNTPEFIPQDGDVGVFNKTATNPAGHIVVCLGGGTVSRFMRFEQNSPIGTNAHISEGGYTNFLGVLRPKVFPPTGGVTDQSLYDFQGNIGIVELQRGRGIMRSYESKIKEQEDKIAEARNILS